MLNRAMSARSANCNSPAPRTAMSKKEKVKLKRLISYSSFWETAENLTEQLEIITKQI
jgi:hypothetical protein